MTKIRMVRMINIFQVRIDFVDTEMLTPTEGSCKDQYMSISGGCQGVSKKLCTSHNLADYLTSTDIYVFYNISGSIWPTGFGRICGINPDQHFYVHIRKEENFKHIDISITTVRINKSYKFGKRLYSQFDGRDYESKMIYF